MESPIGHSLSPLLFINIYLRTLPAGGHRTVNISGQLGNKTFKILNKQQRHRSGGGELFAIIQNR